MDDEVKHEIEDVYEKTQKIETLVLLLAAIMCEQLEASGQEQLFSEINERVVALGYSASHYGGSSGCDWV